MEHRKKENYDELYNTIRKLISEKGWPFRIMSEGGKMYMDMEAANKGSVNLRISEMFFFFTTLDARPGIL